MKLKLAVLCTLVAICSITHGQTPSPSPFEIKDIKRGINSQVYVDQSWKTNVPVIEVDVRTNEDLQGKKPFVKAYFYDKEKKLIVKADRPSDYTAPGKGTIRIPDYLKPKDTYKVCFGITDQALDVHRKWARVLVVFGEGKRAVAEIYPADDAALFEFDEKAFATVKKK
jgi:hypothetical protein